jgi:MinD superfamily P-loop ATPase
MLRYNKKYPQREMSIRGETMKELTIISGKGGTGKTTITAALASMLDKKIMVDCDVDASNLHLLFKTKVEESNDFYSGLKTKLRRELCNNCKKCLEACRFDAISFKEGQIFIDDLSCVGCGACVLVCPQNVISLEDNLAGRWFISNTSYGPLIHAQLGIAEDNSGKLVAQIRSVAINMATQNNIRTIIIDGPPGIGCPVISSITGVNLVLIVTEPTLSGLHDLKRIINVTNNFGIKSVVCINKYDINLEVTNNIINECKQNNIRIIGKIPFNQKITEGMVNLQWDNKEFIDYLPGEVISELDKMKNFIIKELS